MLSDIKFAMMVYVELFSKQADIKDVKMTKTNVNLFAGLIVYKIK